MKEVVIKKKKKNQESMSHMAECLYFPQDIITIYSRKDSNVAKHPPC